MQISDNFSLDSAPGMKGERDSLLRPTPLINWQLIFSLPLDTKPEPPPKLNNNELGIGAIKS